MQKPPIDPDVADTTPSESVLTVYDEEHVITYLRLLDGDAKGADWRAVARIVLHLDPECIAREMDDGAWLPAPATWWRVGLNERDVCAVLNHDKLLPIRHAIHCNSVAGSSAQRRHASARWRGDKALAAFEGTTRPR